MLCPSPGECPAPLFAPRRVASLVVVHRRQRGTETALTPAVLGLSSYPPGPRADTSSLLRAAPTLTPLGWAFCRGCSAGALPGAVFLEEISSRYK